MADATTSLQSSSLIAAGILKLFSNPPRPSFAIPTAQNRAANTSLIVGAGPLGTVKEPTGDVLMSIVQLGQNPTKAGEAAAALAEAAVNEAQTTAQSGVYLKKIESQFWTNDAETAEPRGDFGDMRAALYFNATDPSAIAMEAALLQVSKKNTAPIESAAARDLDPGEPETGEHGFMGGGFCEFNLGGAGDNVFVKRSRPRPRRDRSHRPRREALRGKPVSEPVG